MKTSKILIFLFTLLASTYGAVAQQRSLEVGFPVLYKDCGNKITLVNERSKTSFKVEGGTMIRGVRGNEITVVPYSPKVTITASVAGKEVAKKSYRVAAPPTPHYKVTKPYRLVNVKQGESCKGLDTLVVSAVCPSQSFETYFPKDAIYEITQLEVLIIRGKRPISIKRFTSDTIYLSSLKNSMQPGDRITIDIKKVVRKNLQGKKLPVRVPMELRTINIPLVE